MVSIPEDNATSIGSNQEVTDQYMTKLEILKKVFGYQEFRPGQVEAIDALISGKDTIIIIPTGGGKTVTYVLPCIITPGTAIVVSPLVMLMHDQVQRLRSLGINTCYYNTLLSDSERQNILHHLKDTACQYQFLFVSPEAVVSEQFQNCLHKLHNESRLSFFIIDEAHCIDTWGSDFRPAFQQLGILRKFNVSFAALTGTATKNTISIIESTLQMNDPQVIKMPCRRDNLHYSIIPKKESQSKKQVAEIIEKDHSDECGIVYCATQSDAVEMAYVLKSHGILATFYHAGLDRHDRLQNASLWLTGEIQVMCCTNAFGMGIDKKNVRFVMHLSQPGSLEDYIQESGRGGRDGETCSCMLFFRFGDRIFHMRNIAQTASKVVRENKLELLNYVSQFCTDDSGCRVQKIAKYFGEDQGNCCYVCDVCQSGVVHEMKDFTQEAKNIVNCLASLIAISPNVKISELAMTYMGSKSKGITTKGFHVVPLYGSGKNTFKNIVSVTTFVHHLILKGIIIENLPTPESRVASTNLTPGVVMDITVTYSI